MDFNDADELDRDLDKTKLSPELREELKRRWRFSLWRILPLPIISYTIVGSYLWMVDTPDAWQRAAAPVIAVMTFITLSPFIKRNWFRRTKRKLRLSDTETPRREHDIRDGQER